MNSSELVDETLMRSMRRFEVALRCLKRPMVCLEHVIAPNECDARDAHQSSCRSILMGRRWAVS